MDATCDSLQRGQRAVGFEGLGKRPPSFRPKIVLIKTGESEQENGSHVTHDNMVSVLLVLRASASARPPSGPRPLKERLERVSKIMDATSDSLQRGQRAVGFEGLGKRPPFFRPKIVVTKTGESEQENGCHK